MKAFNVIDSFIQTVLIIGGLVLIGDALALASVGMYLGPWQLLSSVVGVTSRNPYIKFRAMHLLLSVVYLLIFFAGVSPTGEFIGFGIPIILALYCYAITITSLFKTALKK